MVATTASLTSSSSIINSENAVTPSAVNTTSSTTTSTTLSASSKSRVVGVVRESMRIDPVDHATSEHDSQPASSSSRQMPSQSHLNKGSNGIVAAPSLVGSNDVTRYSSTSMVKPKGHRVRIEPNFSSKAVHLIVPPGPLLVSRVVAAEGCEWGKVHPSMFPAGFKACDTVSDGWCLLRDARDPSLPVTYWRPTP